jgi:hypothetical protein
MITLATVFSTIFVTTTDLIGEVIVIVLAIRKNWDFNVHQAFRSLPNLICITPSSSKAFVTLTRKENLTH